MIGDRWGVTDTEVAQPFDCDDYADGPGLQAWRGVTVDAPVAAVWSWLVQLRLAPYSYDWIDNLGRRSPQDLRRLSDPQPGDPFTASAGRPIGRVLAVRHGSQLTASIMGVVTTYRVTATAPARTRLVMKIVGGNRLLAPLLCVGDLVMARRQLLNLKQLAEANS